MAEGDEGSNKVVRLKVSRYLERKEGQTLAQHKRDMTVYGRDLESEVAKYEKDVRDCESTISAWQKNVQTAQERLQAPVADITSDDVLRGNREVLERWIRQKEHYERLLGLSQKRLQEVIRYRRSLDARS